MKSIHTLALAASLAALLFACKNEPKTNATKPAAENTLPTPLPSPKPEVYLYMATVDKLNLRDQSNKNGKVITQFAQGDFVEGTGEVSANKEEVTLRDIPYNEPYFKVISTTPEQHTGWAYSAALKRVYAGPRSTSPDLGKLVQCSNYFKTLQVKKLESGKKAWDYVKQNLGSAQGTLADASFILLENFLFRMETEGEFYTMTEKISWADTDYDAVAKGTFDMKKYPQTKMLAENGMGLATGEGMIFPTVDWAKLAAFFVGKVTPPMKTYLDQNVMEQKEPVWDDGGIIIPLEKLADRAAWWEKFNRDNPYFVSMEETRESERWLRLSVVTGDNNTPVFNSENGMILDEFKTMWAYVQQKYPGTQLAKTVKEIADLSAAEGWKRTKKVEEWQSKQHETN